MPCPRLPGRFASPPRPQALHWLLLLCCLVAVALHSPAWVLAGAACWAADLAARWGLQAGTAGSGRQVELAALPADVVRVSWPAEGFSYAGGAGMGVGVGRGGWTGRTRRAPEEHHTHVCKGGKAVWLACYTDLARLPLLIRLKQCADWAMQRSAQPPLSTMALTLPLSSRHPRCLRFTPSVSGGQYVYINIPGVHWAEFHPFSLSSAPGSDQVGGGGACRGMAAGVEGTSRRAGGGPGTGGGRVLACGDRGALGCARPNAGPGLCSHCTASYPILIIGLVYVAVSPDLLPPSLPPQVHVHAGGRGGWGWGGVGGTRKQ